MLPQYVTIKLSDYENRRYTLSYEDGPYLNDDLPRISREKNPTLLGIGTEFVGIDHAFVQVELSKTAAVHPPYVDKIKKPSKVLIL